MVKLQLQWSNFFLGNHYSKSLSQGPILCPLLFLININDFLDGLTSIVKLFADGTSLFCLLHDISSSVKDLYEDLNKVNN